MLVAAAKRYDIDGYDWRVPLARRPRVDAKREEGGEDSTDDFESRLESVVAAMKGRGAAMVACGGGGGE